MNQYSRSQFRAPIRAEGQKSYRRGESDGLYIAIYQRKLPAMGRRSPSNWDHVLSAKYKQDGLLGS